MARNLDEQTANRIVVTLEQGGIVTTKDSDSQNEGRWLVSVQRADMAYALGLMSQEGLPSLDRPGTAESVEHSSLVPSLQAEQARLLSGTANDLEHTLVSIDGIASARVHIAVPPLAPAFDVIEHVSPGASVLVRYRGAQLPIPIDAIQQLVAGSVANLTPDRVTVVATRAPQLGRAQRKVVPFGPFAVAPESVAGLRLLIGGFAILNLLMLALFLVLWYRARRNTIGRSDNATSGASQGL